MSRSTVHRVDSPDGVVGAVAEAVDRVATETAFSGVVRVDIRDADPWAKAYGLAHRGFGIANTVESRLGIASGAKGFTALTIVGLVEQGRLEMETTARSVLRDDLPLIDDRVTVEHLLGHWSGIGDYLDEDAGHAIDDYVLAVPVHQLNSTEAYLRVLDGHPMKSPPGERFTYCNGGYVVLALMAERVSGASFAELVDRHVCGPAGMRDTAFLRSDQLPDRTAVGYLRTDGWATNVLHLPVIGSGDGGIYSTVADMHALWDALFGARIVSPSWVQEMVRPRGYSVAESKRYGLGFWLHPSTDAVMLEGYDAGVSFKTVHSPSRDVTHTVISNTSPGAWPLSRLLDDVLEI